MSTMVKEAIACLEREKFDAVLMDSHATNGGFGSDPLYPQSAAMD